MPTSLTLRRPSLADADNWLTETMATYAADLVASGAMDESAAARKARDEQAELLPRGMETPGHLFFKLVDGDKQVGWLWLALASSSGEADTGWVYKIEVDEHFRGRGYGRAAMLLAEEEAQRHGLRRLRLNVFSHNPIAISLYTSLGYQVTSQLVAKSLQVARD